MYYVPAYRIEAAHHTELNVMQAPLLRALPLLPLVWQSGQGAPRDGDVKSSVDAATGETVYTLRVQPHGGRWRGVSFFSPDPNLSPAIHQFLGGMSDCSVLPANCTLPEGLGLVNDGLLELPLAGGDGVVCGEHYTLFVTKEMPTADFEQLYSGLLQRSSAPCQLQAAAEPAELKLDMDCYPADKLTYAAAMALDKLSGTATAPNVRLFAKLYALHLRATDMDFEDVLKFGALASMAAAALEVWTVKDGFLMTDACDAQDQLSEALDCPFRVPAYTPPWVHPFRFLSGEYTDKLFDEEVKVCAQAYVGDDELRHKVAKAAGNLFRKLDPGEQRVIVESCTVQHRGVTFRIDCGTRGALASQ